MINRASLVLAIFLAPRLAAAGSLADLRELSFGVPAELAAGTPAGNMVPSRGLAVPPSGEGVPFFATGFKQVPNPDYTDPNRLPPPNLKESQLEALIKRMVGIEAAQLGPKAKPSDLSLTREDVMRLAGNLAIIDRNYVDAIPAGVWDQAVKDMGDVAAKEFDAKKKNWETTVNSMINTAASKILDPFSTYWNKDEFKRFQDQMNNSFVGIGAILKEDGTIDIVIPGGPADKAGLKAGDKIVSVDGTAVGTAEEVIKKTLGKEGTQVKIVVVRAGNTLPAATITRGQVQTKNVYSKLAAPGVGYVYLGQFSPESDKEIIAVIGKLREKGAKKVIIDVRGNPGGTVDSVSSILSEFMKDKQRIVSFKRQGKVMWENVTDGDGRFLSMPLMVLVNGGSASASEILAGAIQDVRGPVVVGSRSYGKGSMQTIMPDNEGRALKLTIGRWYTPRDRNIDAQRDPKTREKVKDTGGVVPDHLIVLTEEAERAIMKQLFREVQGASPDGPAVADPVLQKALELLAR
ncbi:MAG: PDZ domain-containing protein [Elusimicrobia bacterium]|nr:PDZ domain-containing protein [Elusimicrobiota bacterium]